MTDELILFGAGGHAKVILESILSARPETTIYVLDDNAEGEPRHLMGRPVAGSRSWIERRGAALPVVPAIGANRARSDFVRWLIERGHSLAAVVDPRALVSASATIEPGAFLAPGAIVNADARIEAAAIINTGASVDHDCRIGFSAHVGPGSSLCGGVEIGAGTLIGAGSTIIPGIRIGSDVVVGAGSVVVRDIPDGARVAGNPARPLPAVKH